MKLIKYGVIAALSMMLFGCASSSSEQKVSVTPQTVSVAEYTAFLDYLDSAIEEGKPRQLNNDEKRQYSSLSASLKRMLDGHESMDSVSADDKQRIANLHERLQAVVMGNNSGQVICRSERSTGSNFKRTACMTRADWEQKQRDVEEFFQQGGGFASGMTGPAGG